MPQFYDFFTLKLFSIYCPIFPDNNTFIRGNDNRKASVNVAFFLVLMGFLSHTALAIWNSFSTFFFKGQSHFVSGYLRRLLLRAIGSGGGGHGNLLCNYMIQNQTKNI